MWEAIIGTPTIRTSGFAIKITTQCSEGHTFMWESQPKIDKIYAANLLIPATVFLTGGSFYNFTEMCQAQALTVRQCHNIQTAFVVPQVNRMWTQHVEAVLAASLDQPLELLGDARCDSPGYCSYP